MSFKSAFDFSGRNVLVVGASRGGIGSAIAAGFADCGATVSITGAETEPVAADQGRYPYAQLDVADPDAVQRLARGIPRLEVLVNCAGIARRDEEYNPDVFVRVLDVNLRGVLHLANAFKPHLVASRGAMITIASMYSTYGSPRVPAYGASKAGVAQLTRSLALAWAEHGVRVNAIAPGFIVTEQTARARADAAHYQRVLDRTPVGRWGQPTDIAGPALFLASPAAAFITGAVIPVDGGYTAV
ncbi:MAG TPA: SDR family oxidoreductase [Candidatus Methylomirabilis sp.]|nr:SDR family oxidoreductase [Candidatus Methylomirabilis sp.]